MRVVLLASGAGRGQQSCALRVQTSSTQSDTLRVRRSPLPLLPAAAAALRVVVRVLLLLLCAGRAKPSVTDSDQGKNIKQCNQLSNMALHVCLKAANQSRYLKGQTDKCITASQSLHSMRHPHLQTAPTHVSQLAHRQHQHNTCTSSRAEANCPRYTSHTNPSTLHGKSASQPLLQATALHS